MSSPSCRKYKVAILTNDILPLLLESERILIELFAEQGHEAVPTVWSDASIDYSVFDLILVRSPWRYYERYPEFMSFLDKIDSLFAANGKPFMFNPTETLRWNTNKAYLLNATASGLPTVPTAWIHSASTSPSFSFEEFMNSSFPTSSDDDKFVLKPSISAGSFGTTAFLKKDASSLQSEVIKLLNENKADVLVQPFVHTIQTHGETSLVFFDGKLSHAVVKKPLQDEFRVQVQWGGQYKLLDIENEEELPKAAQELGKQCVDWASRYKSAEAEADSLLYCRIDIVPKSDNHQEDGFYLQEIECAEPDLYFKFAGEKAAALFVSLAIQKLHQRTSQVN